MRDLVPFLSLAFLAVGDAHVALTFPEARYPPLDFLDTSRTSGPCGVPVPRRPHYTNLLAGSTYNFTWRMQYPHQGGYRIVLIDKDGKTIEELAPINGIEFAGADDQTLVSITKCAIDTTVLTVYSDVRTTGSRMGKELSIQKLCRRECSGDNAWCGKSREFCYALTFPAKAGTTRMGVKTRNAVDMVQWWTIAVYVNTATRVIFVNIQDKLNDNDVIYYRKVKNDVEIILDFSTSSWVSIGWRPEGLDKSCRLFPDLEGVRSKRSATVEMPPLIPPPPSQPIRRDPPPTPSDPHDHEQEQVFDRDHPPAKIAQEGPRPVMPRNNGLLDAALRAPLHAMDCVDVLIGAIRDGRTRVQDSYSRDRSTPLEDSWYDGEMSLVASAGREIDGRTVVMFRRPIQEIEPTDHPLGPGRMFVVWAKGQQQGAYTHGAPSALDAPNSSSTHFYPDDIIKYHGAKNRGVHPIDFTTPVKMPRPGDAAFGVNIAATPSAQLPTHHDTAKHPALTTPSSSPSTSTTSTSHYSYQEDSSTTRDSTILFVLVTAFIALY
ncbi:hypothetical protein ANCCAN_16323 [Ancylostoma caninum]|uniref:DOMON domain-containing protein n=1 Tax=Ancylostoma caninum TaxID=29170 RepID=A0A368G091_ANCCA|nr:hypothetical protein ANCCAN_16323 [Ancylostoma caninum]